MAAAVPLFALKNSRETAPTVMEEAAAVAVISKRGKNVVKAPPPPPGSTMAYSKFVSTAPLKALVGVVVDGDVPAKFRVTPRCRERHQVGHTNRWRLPESLGSDMLGSYQAMRAVRLPSFDKELRPAKSGSGESGNSDSDGERLIVAKHPTPPISPEPLRIRRNRIPGFHSNRPISSRPTSPLKAFLHHCKQGNPRTGPDMMLQCLGTNWELHKHAAQRSDLLRYLIKNATKTRHRLVYSPEANPDILADEPASRGPSRDSLHGHVDPGCDHVTPQRGHVVSEAGAGGGMTIISVRISNPAVTKYALAVCLGNLYRERFSVDDEDLLGVLTAACLLQYKQLVEACARQITRCIDETRVCSFYQIAVKFGLDEVKTACFQWMEVNLIPKVSSCIELRQISSGLMQRLLKSPNLFVTSESKVMRTLSCWLYLRLNPSVLLMPAQSQVVHYFDTLPKGNSFLQREEGHGYLPLFSCLRLHGITDPSVIADLRQMNILPQSWLIDLITQQYKAVQTGGDMKTSLKFNKDAVRYGFFLEEPPEYHSEVISLHGFHFELKATKVNDKFEFCIQRLGLSAPAMSVSQSERQAFSMRPDRPLHYSITAQTLSKTQSASYTTGEQTQIMGVAGRNSKSQVLSVARLTKPIYVMFSLLFAPAPNTSN